MSRCKVAVVAAAKSGRVVLVALVASAHALLAQRVQGRTVSADGASPIQGVIVSILDSTGTQIARALSADGGTFSIALPHSARIQVQTLRIGLKPTTSDWFDVPAGKTIEYLARLSNIPVVLSAVEVHGKQSCKAASDTAANAFALWTEARKALLASVIARQDRAYVATTLRYRRMMDPSSQTVQSQTTELVTGNTDRPFRAVDPAALERDGYIHADAAGVVYYAPDADVMLSESFATTHCFAAVASKNDSLIGLAFAPVESRRERSDISGTLWLEKSTAELRELTFQYTNRDRVALDAGEGGTLTFSRLPNQLWAITSWRISMPAIQIVEERSNGVSAPSRHSELLKLNETGGALIAANDAAGRRFYAGSLPSVVGRVVYAEGAHAAVAGAVVQLEGTTARATSDSGGRFTLTNIPAGRYRVAVHLPIADSLGIAPAPAVRIDVDSRSGPLLLRIPAIGDVYRRICGDGPHAGVSALLRGTVRDVDGAALREPAHVVLSWGQPTSFTVGATSVQYRATRQREFDTNRVGDFSLCDVALEVPIAVRIESGEGLVVSDSLQIKASERVMMRTFKLQKEVKAP